MLATRALFGIAVAAAGTLVSAQRPLSIDDRIAQMASCDNVAVVTNIDNRGRAATELTGQIAEIVKQTERTLEQRGEVSFLVDARRQQPARRFGQRASGPWNRDARYLMCLNRRNASGPMVAENIYAVQPGEVLGQPFDDGAIEDNALYGKPLYNVVTAVRDAAGVSVRRIWRSREPIASRLVPQDRIVEIRVLSIDEPGMEMSRAVELSIYEYVDEVLLVRELDRRPVFAGKESWIRSRVRAVVETVYKTNRLAAAPGATVEYDYDGGEMTINGVLVKTMHDPVYTDRRQLIALMNYPDFIESNAYYLRPVKLFGVAEDGTLQRWLFRDGIASPKSQLYGLKLEAIEDALRKVKRP